MKILNQTWREARATWVRPGEGQRSAIDYCLVRRRARERVGELWVDEENEVGVTSDHRLVTIQIGREVINRGEKNRKINRWNLKSERWRDYREKLKGRENGEEKNIYEMDEKLKQDIIQCTERTIGRVRRKVIIIT